MSEDKLRTRIEIATVLAVILLVVVIGLFAVVSVQRGVLQEKLDMLYAEQARIEQERISVEDEAQYRLSQSYIEEYARQLDMLKDGETRYVPK